MKLWIRLNVDSPRDPRIGRLANALKLPPRYVFGMVVAVWCAMGEHAQDGDLASVSDATLDEWAGAGAARGLKPGQFAVEFIKAFLDERRCDPQFREYQGKLVEEAQKARDRMTRIRNPVSEQFANPSRTTESNAANSSTLRNGTQRDETERNNPQQVKQRARTDSGQATKGAAMKIFGDIRAARVGSSTPQGTRYHVPREFLESLDKRTHAAIDGIGGAHLIAAADEEKLPILRSQFAEMYLATQSAT